MKPRPGCRPLPFHGSSGASDQLGRFGHRHPGKETESYDLGHVLVELVQTAKGFVQGEDLLGFHLRRCGQALRVEGHSLLATTVFGGRVSTRSLDQDPLHRLCGGSKEIGPVAEVELLASKQPQIGFMDETGRLQGLACRLTRHPGAGERAQLSVNEGQELVGGTRVIPPRLPRIRSLPGG